MTRRPFQPGELDDFGSDLEPAVEDLERYLADSADDPSGGFADRVMLAVASEPTPRRGLLGIVAAAFRSDRARLVLAAATIAVAILAVVVAGQLSRLIQPPVGTPPPAVITPSPEPSSPAPSIKPPPSLSPSDEPSPSPSDAEDGSGSPDPSDDEDRTPSPSGSPQLSDDHSGPGGGDDSGGNSGPGSG
jgi:hypothetical protein